MQITDQLLPGRDEYNPQQIWGSLKWTSHSTIFMMIFISRKSFVNLETFNQNVINNNRPQRIEVIKKSRMHTKGKKRNIRNPGKKSIHHRSPMFIKRFSLQIFFGVAPPQPPASSSPQLTPTPAATRPRSPFPSPHTGTTFCSADRKYRGGDQLAGQAE